MDEMPYNIPSSPVIFEEEIKKSIFITHLAHTPSVASAKCFIDEVKQKNQGARHYCWGYVLGRPEDSLLWGFSDDGEPSGTAGKPILAQLSGSGVGEMTAVVVRYSGGIKLGTGGLVKAYGGGVQQALKRLVTEEKKITELLKVELSYSFMPQLQAIMQQYQVVQNDAHFGNSVILTLEVEKRVTQEFNQILINKTSGKILITHLESEN